MSYAENAQVCRVYVRDKDMDSKIQAQRGKYRAEKRLFLPGPLKHDLQAGQNLIFLKSRGQILPLRSRMKERCCLATKQIFFYCVNYDCQSTKFTINILWVVNSQIHFPNPNPSFHVEWQCAKKMLLEVTGYWQLLGKLKEQSVLWRQGAEPQTERKWERLELACLVLEAPTIRVTHGFLRIGRDQESSSSTLGSGHQPQMKHTGTVCLPFPIRQLLITISHKATPYKTSFISWIMVFSPEDSC